MSDAVIRADRLTKHYGRTPGVLDLSFEVRAGEVLGFLGPNGAGKTTTIRLLLDLIRPTAGRVEVFGLDTRRHSREIRRRTGYLPGDLRLYERLTARDHLRYFAGLRGLTDLADGEAIAGRLELELDRPVRALSKGNRQKVGVLLAFFHRPELLVLDEPTSGLDPLVQQVVYALLRERVADGGTVFLSSHVLAEVQEVAERVAAVRAGRLQLLDTVEALRTRTFTRVEVGFRAPPPPHAFDGLPGVRELERRGDAVVLSLIGPADPLVKALARYEVATLDSREPDLEDVFLDLFRERPRAA
jgi:beta-exotoxin I transport system ATP-binding protein